MPQGLYSERFFIAFGTELFTRYTVAAGKRAVIKSLTYGKDSNASGYFWLFVESLGVLYKELPAAAVGDAVNLTTVVYAGETMEVYTSYVGLKVAVSGYLFDDFEGAGATEGLVTRERAAQPRAG